MHGDMGHGGLRRCAMPVLFARGKPDDVAGPDILDRPTPALGTAKTGRDDECLAQWMSVPSGASASFERNGGTLNPVGRAGIEERIDADGAGEPVGRPLAGGPAACAKDFRELFLSAKSLLVAASQCSQPLAQQLDWTILDVIKSQALQ